MDRTVLVFHRSGEKAATGIEYIASVRVCPNVSCKGLIFAITDGVAILPHVLRNETSGRARFKRRQTPRRIPAISKSVAICGVPGWPNTL